MVNSSQKPSAAKVVCSAPPHVFRALGGRLRLFSAAIFITLPFLFIYNVCFASIYICRDAGGTMHFTNVRNSGQCKSYRLKGEKRSYQNYSNSAGPSSSRYDGEIKRIAKRYSVDPSLIKAIIHTESDFDHQAVSRRGAQGLMQLMPATAKELKVYNPFDPRENIDGGTRYFRKLMDNFEGSLILSLAAYNAGPGLVMRTGGVPQIPETRRYVNKVLKRYKVYKASW